MKERKKRGENISIKQIMGQFWKGVEPKKNWFFFAYGFFLLGHIINVIVPLYYKDLFDLLASSTAKALEISILVKIIFIVLILRLLNQTFFQIGVFYFSKMQSTVMARLKQNSFNYMSLHSYTFFTNNFSGSLVQRISRFSRAFESLSDSLAFNMMPLFITVVGSIWVTWFVAPIVSVILFLWVLAFTTFSIIFSTWKLKYDTAVAEADSRTTGYLSDAITNNNAMSFFTGHTHEATGFAEVSNDQAKKLLFSRRLGNVVDAVQIFFISVVEFFIFYYAIRYWSQGLITVGTFVLAQTYIIGVAHQLWGVNRIIRSIYQSIADSKEMVDILLTPYEIKDVEGAKKLVVDKGGITFDKVSFNFGEDNSVLNNVNLSIKPGEKIAVIGPSGAGKTTLARLIMRLYDVASGQISIDGQNISSVTQNSLRENISFVPQDPILFHRTLMDNIRYGKRSATDEEVRNAAHLAHCDEFIDKLPLKYDTYVGERGIKLSGGERQRVAIARAILKKSPILIFDEATSALDSYSESLIQDALENLMKDSTTIVIAHRLSTVKKMDRIIVMNDGGIVEEGTHDELSAIDGGLYKKLWDLQTGGFL